MTSPFFEHERYTPFHLRSGLRSPFPGLPFAAVESFFRARKCFLLLPSLRGSSIIPLTPFHEGCGTLFPPAGLCSFFCLGRSSARRRVGFYLFPFGRSFSSGGASYLLAPPEPLRIFSRCFDFCPFRRSERESVPPPTGGGVFQEPFLRDKCTLRSIDLSFPTFLDAEVFSPV